MAFAITTKRDRHVGNFIIEQPKSEGQRETGLILAGDLKNKSYLDLANRVYDADGLAPTVHCRTGGGMRTKIEVNSPNIVLAGVMANVNVEQARRVYDVDYIAPTISAGGGTGSIPKIEVDPDE